MGNKYPKRIRVFLIVMELVSILPIYLPWYYLPKKTITGEMVFGKYLGVYIGLSIMYIFFSLIIKDLVGKKQLILFLLITLLKIGLSTYLTFNLGYSPTPYFVMYLILEAFNITLSVISTTRFRYYL